MKKEVIHFVQYVLVKILFFGAAYPLQPINFELGDSPGAVMSFQLEIWGPAGQGLSVCICKVQST